MYKIGFGSDLKEGLPPKILYNYLWETLDEIFELDSEGGWHLDGCSGYCPGCFQRPWCDSGLEICWPEDEEAGEMSFPDSLREFVSASPVSLDLLLEYKEDEDPIAQHERNQDSGYIRFPFDIPGVDENLEEDLSINLN